MTPERADRLRLSIAATPHLADAVIDRIAGIEPNGAFPIDVASRSRTIAAALEMIIANADIAGEIRQRLGHARPAVIGDLKNATLAARIRDEMLSVIRDSAVAWDDELARDWRDVVDTVADAILAAA